MIYLFYMLAVIIFGALACSLAISRYAKPEQQTYRIVYLRQGKERKAFVVAKDRKEAQEKFEEKIKDSYVYTVSEVINKKRKS